MKINWTITREPKKNSVTIIVFSDPKRLAESIRQTGKAVFTVEKHTKTSLFIQIHSSEKTIVDSFAVTHVPKGAEDLKYVRGRSVSFMGGEMHENNYLRIGKTQGLPELKRYITAILEQYLPGTESLDIELIIRDVPELED